MPQTWEATESTNFTLAQALPTLTNATFNPTHQAEGQSVTVRLEFDKALQAASAELGGSAVTLTKTADAKVWTGDVVVPVSSELTVGLVVKDYQDLSGIRVQKTAATRCRSHQPWRSRQ